MTMAVCFHCGAIKFGAFCPCPECAALPHTDDDLALSLAMTDHYFDQASLEQMGGDIKGGKPVKLDPETRANLIGQLRQMRDSGMLAPLDQMIGRAPQPDGEKEPPTDKPS